MQLLINPNLKRNAKVCKGKLWTKTIFVPEMLMWKKKKVQFFLVKHNKSTLYSLTNLTTLFSPDIRIVFTKYTPLGNEDSETGTIVELQLIN